MTFRVGQKVVCVDTSQGPVSSGSATHASDFLVKGRIYTIRWVGDSPYRPWTKYGPMVCLEGIVRNDPPHWMDFPFGAFRFRPLVEKQTDISIFTEILRKATKKERA